jgi:AraC-like DNA-binding protein
VPQPDRADVAVDLVDEYVQGLAAPALRPFVAWYSGYRQRGVAPALHRGLPSPWLTLIFTLDEPLTVLGHPDPRQPGGDFDTLLGGLHSSPAVIAHEGAQSGIQVALSPLGARALLGLPAGELAQLDIPADTVFGAACAEARERMRGAATWPARFAVLDEVLLRRARADRLVPPEVARAWRLLVRAGGTVAATDLADEVGWSGRHLANRFRVEIGLTPKAAARVARFDRARRLLGARAQHLLAAREDSGDRDRDRDRDGGSNSHSGAGAAYALSTDRGPVAARGAPIGVNRPGYCLADLAAECGYFDQAHLAREFRALAGMPPSRWLAEEFRNVQVLDGADGEVLVPYQPLVP